MSAVRNSRALGRRLRWIGLAAVALLACSAPVDDGDSSGEALSLTNCEAHQLAFRNGEEDIEGMRKSCSKDVTDYTSSQKVNFDWFKNSPLGLAGPPTALLLAMMDDTSIWPPNTLGLAANTDPPNAAHPNMGLPYGLVYQKNPETHLNHVFFSCGGCHTGRVVGADGKIKQIYGAPNTEVDAQMFGWRVRQSVIGLEPGDDPAFPNGKEGFAKVEKDAQGNYVFDDEGFPKFSVTATGEQMKSKTKDKIDNPGFVQDITEWGVYQFAWTTIIKKLVAGAVRTDTMYGKLTHDSGSYPEKAGSPKRVGPRPGMMDAYGFASGLVYTHAMRDDYFAKIKARYGSDYASHPFFQGLVTAGQSDKDLFAKARARIQANPNDWVAKDPAPVDVKSLFNLADRPNVGWDGNQAGSARIIASGTSSVGDPWNVNLPMHQGMNDFVKAIPAEPYPFAINAASAKAGAKLFEANCSSCHRKGNDSVIPLAVIKTDPNRANIASPIARAGLIELMHEACDGTGNNADVKSNVSLDGVKGYSNAWCTPKDAKTGGQLTLRQQDNELWREAAVRGSKTVGYKADDLRGIWVQAPYLHNGSVPTLWHLLNPNERPKVFVRGNVNYDQEKVGFAWETSKDLKPSYPAAHVEPYDTSLRGQSNAGHTYGANLSKDEKLQLIEFLKSL